ncbi:sugar ABC transporter substrate-binding protein [Phototrophicus methaneseepsis]|uniref:Sugar ABC transporter substrate-binding protein n=1 Tax=Phototrophicus methaneseepsis TaxID=2710758 RepID=A0A7S8IFK2_9CHLR|nr:sugar ABC transporter substrate-binding protein [Phototrophicus methaneseepsis]QPC83686.1 sugar ABC transporter substrate-binding protein [Phototrophicus methaneseepsis]
MKRSALFISMVLLLVSLVGLTSAQETTIRYFTFSAAPDHLEDLNTIIAAFQEENPGIAIEVETAPFADYFTLLQAGVASGDAPDVFELNYENFVTYAANGTLLDLSAMVSEDAPFYPRALEAFSYDGQQLALPETFSTVLLYYNADLFDAAGIDYPTAEWTWEDATAAAEAISALGDDTWGLFSPVQFWEFYKKAAQNGECEFLNEEGTESLINSPACVETLEWMVSVMNDGLMPTAAQLSGVSDSELFLSGKLGMIVTGIWMFGAFEEADFAWDVQLEPMMNQHAHHFFANGVGVSSTTSNPEAAAAWVEFLTSSEVAATVRVDSSWELPALDKPEYFESYLEQTPPENREAVFQALESPVTPPVIVRQNEMQDGVNALIQRVVDGELSAQEALDMAKEEIDSLLD